MSDVKAILVSAAALVDEIGPQDDLREAMFVKAVDLMWAEHADGADRAASTAPLVARSGPMRHASGGAVATRLGESSPMAAIAARLRMDAETVEQVLHVEEGRIDVVVPGSRLDPAKARATKQLALLTTAGRQGAEFEEWTDAEQVRQLATEFRRYDSANFASAIKEMDDVMLIRQSGRKILLRLSRPGWEAAAVLIRRLAGEAE